MKRLVLSLALYTAMSIMHSTAVMAMDGDLNYWGRKFAGQDFTPVRADFFTDSGAAGYRLEVGAMVGVRSWYHTNFDFPDLGTWTQDGHESAQGTIIIYNSGDPGGYFPPYCNDPYACIGTQPCGSGWWTDSVGFSRTMQVSNTDTDIRYGPWTADIDAIRDAIDTRCEPNRAAYLKSIWTASALRQSGVQTVFNSVASGFGTREVESALGQVLALGEQAIGELAAAQAQANAALLAAQGQLNNDLAFCAAEQCGAECDGGGACEVNQDELERLRDEVGALRAEVAAQQQRIQQLQNEIANVQATQAEATRSLSWQQLGSTFASAACNLTARIATSFILAAAISAPNTMRVNSFYNAACVGYTGLSMLIVPGRNSIGAFYTAAAFMVGQGIVDFLLSNAWLAAQCTPPQNPACAAATATYWSSLYQAVAAWAIGLFLTVARAIVGFII